MAEPLTRPPYIGAVVHYVAQPRAMHRPAVVTETSGGTTLYVIGQDRQYYLANVREDEIVKAPGTWHWAEGGNDIAEPAPAPEQSESGPLLALPAPDPEREASAPKAAAKGKAKGPLGRRLR